MNKKKEFLKKLPEKVYILHGIVHTPNIRLDMHKPLAADFFVLNTAKYEPQGFHLVPPSSYAIKFMWKYRQYIYVFSGNNNHNIHDGDFKWNVSFDGWVDVTDWLRYRYGKKE
jgi:hypothetical protein